MELLLDAAEAGGIDVRVDLRGGDVGVSQEFLNDAQVGTAAEEVSGEGVSEHVWVNAREAGGGGVFSDELPDGDALEGSASAREEQASLREVGSAHLQGAAEVEVLSHGVLGGLADGNQALLVALAGDDDDDEGGVEVFDFDTGDFGSAQAAGVHEFEHGAIAQVQRWGVFGSQGIGFWGFDQEAHLPWRKNAGEFFPSVWAIECVGGAFRERACAGEPAEEDLEGGQVTCDAGAAEFALGVKTSEVVGEIARGDIGGRSASRGGEVGEQIVEIARVGLDACGREAAFDFEERDELRASLGEGGAEGWELWRARARVGASAGVRRSWRGGGVHVREASAVWGGKAKKRNRPGSAAGAVSALRFQTGSDMPVSSGEA